MENQHRKIATYRELTQVEIDLMNEIKAFESKILSIVDRLTRTANDELPLLLTEKKAFEAGEIYQDPEKCHVDTRIELSAESIRWASIGRDQVQLGLMALTRAVARPNSGGF